MAFALHQFRSMTPHRSRGQDARVSAGGDQGHLGTAEPTIPEDIFSNR